MTIYFFSCNIKWQLLCKIENIGTKYDGWLYYKYLNIEYSIESE